MANFIVTNTNDSGAGSLRQAIANSNNSDGADRIIFDSSLSGSTINLTSGEIRIDDDLTIEGLGADNLTIDAGGNSRVFYTVGGFNGLFSGPGRTTDVTVKGLTITGGFSSSDGGAIFAEDSFTSTLNLIIEESIISGNSAGGDGGGVFADERMLEPITISRSTISGNSAGVGGGGVFADEIEILDSTISGNSAGVGGGGVFARSVVRAIASAFVENTTGGLGGGLAGQTIISVGSTFSNNRAGLDGGGIRTEGATIILNSNISENEADGNGGGISVAQRFAPLIFGGDKTTLIANTTISGNKAKGSGGGIEVVGQRIQLIPIDFDLPQSANLVATNVTITNNVADSDNNGVGSGGGIWNTPSGTFGDFETERFILSPGDITLENSIIAGNFDTPENNGVGFIAPDISGAARGNANNLLGNTQGLTIETSVAPASESLGAGSDIISANPGLGTLQDNGGLTQTIELLPGSPAINGGDNNKILRETSIDVDGDGNPTIFNFDNNPNTTNAQIPYDQRFGSFSRIVGEIVDIGAFEVQTIIAPCAPTNGDDDLTDCATPNDDSINGLGGNDTLIGEVGNDNLRGNANNDILNGGGGKDTLIGGGGRDTLIGGGGSDILRGQGGRDILTGGASNDVLNGGGGNDQFVFDTGNVFNSSDLGIDRILDFSVGSDKIRLSKDTFAALNNTSNGRLRSADFEIVANNNLASGSSAEIVYNSNNGNLYYNENNEAGGFGNGGLFAKLTGSPDDLSARDFQVVDV